MTYKLFYADGSASQGIQMVLEELEQPYELIQSTKDRSKPRGVSHALIVFEKRR